MTSPPSSRLPPDAPRVPTVSDRDAAARDDNGISLVGEVNVLLRHWRLVVVLPLAMALVAVAGTLIRGRAYQAESRFTPQAEENNAGRLAGLAAQFGVNLGEGANPNESVEFYTELLASRDLLRAAVQTEYRFAIGPGSRDTISGTLVEIYRVAGRTADERLLAAVDILQKHVVVSTGLRRAGIVTLTTSARWPALAVATNRRLLELINDFNLQQRQSQAREKRHFIEGRIAQVREELQSAEGDLARFLEQNRQYQSSPRLVFEAERLQRRLELVQQVYTTLAKAFEEARIEEVRSTPVITVMDNPEGSARRAGRLRLRVLVGAMLGGILAVILAFTRDYVRRERSLRPQQYQEFERLWHTIAVTLSPRRLLPGRRPPS